MNGISSLAFATSTTLPSWLSRHHKVPPLKVLPFFAASLFAIANSAGLKHSSITAAEPPTRPSTASDPGLIENLAVHVDTADQSMVVSDSAAASRIGTEVLKNGGNSVDAAVATAFALAVAWPDAGNIGGGGFMMIRPSNGINPVCIDYREIAPKSMNAYSFLKSDTTFTHKAVGVPGTVRGLALAHQQYGRLPWRDLVLPAAQLAKRGVQVDRPLSDSLNSVLSEKRVREEPRFAEFRRVFGHPESRDWRPGDQLIQPDLSETLMMIADQGSDAFYTGSIAKMLVSEMETGRGEITASDLQHYQAKTRPVIRGSYRGYTILGAPPPSSGGTCIVEALNILECFDLARHERYHPRTVHLLAEAMRRAFADRAMHLGDPDFIAIPKHLTEKQYARKLAKTIDLNTATPSDTLGPPIREAYESPDTTHFSVVDAEGMAVSNTYTLEATWGSRIVVRGAGFVLNNEMGDFNWFPGETNQLGRIGTIPNQLQAGKRMLSSQCPVIVERDGSLVMVTGSPGGRTIINTVLCVLVNMIDYKQSPAEAVSSMRMHHQWFPDRILLESVSQLPHSSVASALNQMGHVVANRPGQGSAHSITIDPQTNDRLGISDFRRSGRPSAVRSGSIATWHFDEPAGTKLSNIKDDAQTSASWHSNIPGAITNGFDLLRIGQPPKQDKQDPVSESKHTFNFRSAKTAFVQLKPPSPDKPLTRLVVEIKIDNLNFTDDSKERIHFSLGDVSDTDHRHDSSLFLSHRKQAGICVGSRVANENSDLSPLRTKKTDGEPFLLQIEHNFKAQKMIARTRAASDESWRKLSSRELPSTTPPNVFRLTWDSGEPNSEDWIEIDRIEILRW